jgi:hypothetical protein
MQSVFPAEITERQELLKRLARGDTELSAKSRKTLIRGIAATPSSVTVDASAPRIWAGKRSRWTWMGAAAAFVALASIAMLGLFHRAAPPAPRTALVSPPVTPVPPQPKPVAEPIPAAPLPKTAKTPAAPAPAAKVGYLTLDTDPWTEVHFQDKSLGVTPIIKVKLPAGAHPLHLVNTEQKIDVVVEVNIKAGQVTTKKLSF